MRAGDDERRPRQGGDTSSRHPESPTHPRQKPRATTLQYWAERHEIDGGKQGYLLLFVRCRCGGVHAHRAPRLFLSGKRRGNCGAVYIVHSGVALTAVAS